MSTPLLQRLGFPKTQRPEIALGLSLALTHFSGAAQVAIYLFLGVPPVLGIPFFVLAAFIGFICVIRVADRIVINPLLGLCAASWFAFVIWAACAANWSTSLVVVNDKLIDLIGYCTIFYFMGLVMGRSSAALAGFRAGVLILSVIVIATLMLGAVRSASVGRLATQIGSLKLFAEAYQSITACLATAAIFALVEVLRRRHGLMAWLWGGAWVVLSIATLAGGGRGAAIGCFVGQIAIFIVAIVIKPHEANRGLASVFLSLLPIGLALSFLIATQLKLETVTRIALSLSSSSVDSTGREGLWTSAVKMGDHNLLFGSGFGSYEATGNFIEDAGSYPHNLFLESIVEMGLVGFILFSFALAVAIGGVLARRSQLEFLELAIWAGLLSETLVEINVSGTVTDHMLVFVLGFSAGLIAVAEEKLMVSRTDIAVVGQ